MDSLPYKEYLEIFSKFNKEKVSLSRVALGFFVAVLFVTVLSFAITNQENKGTQALRNEKNYLEKANSGFFKAQQALGDLYSSFQVAGVKVEKVDELKESTPTPGYFITLGETQKSIAKIKSTKESLEFEKNELKKEEVPQIYSQVSTELDGYLGDASIFLSDLERKQTDLKDLLIATGPNFYLPVLSDELVWQTQDKDKIKLYYEKKREEAQTSMISFAQVPTDPALKDFKDIQISYYQLLINVSDNVLKVLAKEDSGQNADSAPTVEEAYQVLTGAKRENEIIAAKILEERLKITNSPKYFESVNKLKNKENILLSYFSAGNIKTVQKVNKSLNSSLINSANKIANSLGLYKLDKLYLK